MTFCFQENLKFRFELVFEISNDALYKRCKFSIDHLLYIQQSIYRCAQFVDWPMSFHLIPFLMI